MVMITINGAQGEGGGQVLRTSLSLAALTGRTVRIYDIRAGRSRPGLRPQHLTVVRALAMICRAHVDGAEIGSQQLTFRPQGAPQAGDYQFDVNDAAPHGSAGSVTLIAHALLWPLLFAAGPSRVILQGGTHVPFSPPFHHLADVAQPAFARFGADCEVNLEAWGWLPAGEGEIGLDVAPLSSLAPVTFERVPPERVRGVAAVTNLPAHIPQRMARRADNLLRAAGLETAIQPLRERGAGPGAGIYLWLPQAGFGSLGRKGLPADKVAEAAVAELLAFVENEGAAVDDHLADQLLIPMALARGRSTFTTHRISRHTTTNAAILRQWLGVEIAIVGETGAPGRITVEGVGYEPQS
jgi:RNA 3'-terminal phosphate cyclase (ATP)